MAFTTEDALADIGQAREYFKKHIATMTKDGWDFQPFPHVNSVRQILMHVIATNRTVSAMLNGEAFDMAQHGARHKEVWEHIEKQSPNEVIALLDETSEVFIAIVRAEYADAPLDAPLMLWGMEEKLGRQLGRMSQEMAYHTGQVSLIRQAFDPSWDYFGDVFGAS